MISGTTSSGFDYQIDERILSDWRLIDAIADSQDEDDTVKLKGTMKLAKFIAGKDMQRLTDHVAELNDGYIPTAAVMAEINDIMNAAKLKNSSSSPTV